MSIYIYIYIYHRFRDSVAVPVLVAHHVNAEYGSKDPKLNYLSNNEAVPRAVLFFLLPRPQRLNGVRIKQ